jgi:pSer/pThr/pTyr-binding forkhead associated (FHA) protein
MSQDQPQNKLGGTEPSTSPQTPSEGSTTHDLRQQALEAIRMLREASVTQTIPVEMPFQPPSQPPTEATQAATEPTQEVTEAAALFGPGDSLCLTLSESGASLTFSLQAEPLMIGRTDTLSEYHPDIDLSDYGAYRLGLSRKHAQIVRQGQNLWLIDLGGRNGTYLNAERLQPHRPYVLRDGDQLMLGNLGLSLSFQRSQ